MKDIQGIQRGKCNSCECEEYRVVAQSQGGSLRCEYCNHTPGEHVRIIELGACEKCGQEECDKYQSEDPNSYTDCGYCGCGANRHAGAEKLRKPTSRPLSQQGGMAPPGHGMPQAHGGGMSAGFQPRQDAYGQTVQMAAFGTCKCPGCNYPRRIEGDKIHDFCSKTCARKLNEMQSSSFYQQKKMAASQAVQQQSGPSQASVTSQPPLGGNPGPGPSASGPSAGGGIFSSFFGSSSASTPQLGGPSVSTGGQATVPTGRKLCTKCQTRAAYPRKGWCQQCYQQSTS